MSAPAAVPSAPAPVTEVVELLPVDRLRPSRFNPRRTYSVEGLAELTESVRALGIQQPITVRPAGAEYEIVFGHRRHDAARRAGLSHVPAIVRALTDDEALEVATVENVQREDMNAIDEALALRELRKVKGWTQTQLAERLGKGQSWVARREQLLTLPEKAQRLVVEGTVSPAAAVTLATVEEAPSGFDGGGIYVGSKYRNVKGPADLWKIAAEGASQHELEEVVKNYRNALKRHKEQDGEAARLQKLLDVAVAEQKAKHPDRPLFVTLDTYNLPKGAIEQIAPSGWGASVGSAVCPACKKCDRTGILIKPSSAYSAEKRTAKVLPVGVDKACNERTAQQVKGDAVAKRAADDERDHHEIEALRQVQLTEDQAWTMLGDWYEERFGAKLPERSIIAAGRGLLVGRYQQMYDAKSRQKLLDAVGVSLDGASDKPVPAAPKPVLPVDATISELAIVYSLQELPSGTATADDLEDATGLSKSTGAVYRHMARLRQLGIIVEVPPTRAAYKLVPYEAAP